jgi:RNA polymerase sigma-70 factor (ECF subfamily)
LFPKSFFGSRHRLPVYRPFVDRRLVGGRRTLFPSFVLPLVSLSEVDRLLLQRCLDQAPRAWQDFVDRFLGLVVHVANHTAGARGISIDQATRDDLVSDVFLTLITGDYAVLRRFRRNCSLATYLTVISRRVISRRLLQSTSSSNGEHQNGLVGEGLPPGQTSDPTIQRIDDQEEVQKLMLRLDPKEANVVRMYHLEGKSYDEISRTVGISENSVGPVLSRARQKMRGE